MMMQERMLIPGMILFVKEAMNMSVRGECFPFDPSIHRAARGTDETTSHSTSLPKDGNQVAGYQGERKMYRTIAGTYSALP